MGTGNLIAIKTENEFWIVDESENNLVNLTPNTNVTYHNRFSWSHDGDKLGYIRIETINIIDLTGNITTIYDEVGASSVSWSPQTDDIAFTGETPEYYSDIFVLDTNHEATNLTNTPTLAETFPLWSPNGKHIAYLAMDLTKTERVGDIGIIDLESETNKIITNELECEVGFNYSWSSDSERIAFACKDDTNWDIWIINRDGSNAVNLTGN